MFFKEFIARYLVYSKVNKRPKSYENDLNSLKALKNYFGDTYLSEINPALIENFKIERLNCLKRNSVNRVKAVSVNKELNCLRAMMTKAFEWELITTPLKRFKKLKEPPGRVRYLSREEISALLSKCSSYLRPVVMMALTTGMRKGEMMALRWQNIDFENKIVHIENSKTYERRDLPLVEDVAIVLQGMERKNDFVFEGVKDPKKGFLAACRRAGITDFRFHDLRHTFASQLVMTGTNIMVVKELLGHKTLNMTLRYAHLAPDMRKTAVDNLWTIINGEAV